MSAGWDWLIETDAPPVVPPALAVLLDDLDRDDETDADALTKEETPDA